MAIKEDHDAAVLAHHYHHGISTGSCGEDTDGWRVRGSPEAGLSLTGHERRARCLRSGCCFLAALEALPAKHRASLRGLERNRRFLSTIRANRVRLYLGIVRVYRQPEGLGPFALATLATLRFVLKLFIVEEKLFSRGKDEILPAVNALQNSVLEFHPSCPFVAVRSDTVATTECNAAPDAFIRRVQSYLFDPTA